MGPLYLVECHERYVLIGALLVPSNVYMYAYSLTDESHGYGMMLG